MPAKSNEKILEESQKLTTDNIVKLYELDATAIGGQLYRFVSTIDTEIKIADLSAAANIATAVSVNPHGLSNGDGVALVDWIPTTYNGVHSVTVVDPNTFTFTMSDSPANPVQLGYAARLNNTMLFNGYQYVPTNVEAIGFEWNGQGSIPTPKLRVSQVNRILTGAVITLNDLVGATFTRIRTYRKHLDDGSDPDVDAMFPKEIYRINRKSIQNKLFLEFELAASMDQEGVKIPGRICIKNTCTHRYRIWNAETGSFDYTKATCPYVESASFTNLDQPTSDPSQDRCAKHLSSCELRFGTNPLPTRAFPGIGGQ